MTGKEALGDLYYGNLDNFIDIERVNKAVEIIKQDLKRLDKAEQELTKYKRAFEILKHEFNLNYEEDEYFCNKKYFLRSDTNVQLEKEEAELLEELMRDESR